MVWERLEEWWRVAVVVLLRVLLFLVPALDLDGNGQPRFYGGDGSLLPWLIASNEPPVVLLAPHFDPGAVENNC